MTDRIAVLERVLGKPYALGAGGPDSFDCYGIARMLQLELFGRAMPEFSIPGTAGRFAMASAIAAHPERLNWREVDKPSDGAIVTMARHLQGYHLGTWLPEDGGVVVHAMETVGVVASRIFELEAEGWRRFRFHIPLNT